MILEWVAIDNPFTWADLNGVSEDDAFEASTGKLIDGDIDSVKANASGSGNFLRLGEIIRLPVGFTWTRKVYSGTIRFFCPFTIDFRVEYIEYDTYVMGAVNFDIRFSGAGFFNIHMPKYLVNPRNEKQPINWRNYVVTGATES